MPLEWKHENCGADCPETTECPSFPTRADRIAMAQSAYAEYAAADDTAIEDFVIDVLLFATEELGEAALEGLLKRARDEYSQDPEPLGPR